jgi:hypothetical protein
MIEGYESVMNQPAWKKMRNMHIHPHDAVLPMAAQGIMR